MRRTLFSAALSLCFFGFFGSGEPFAHALSRDEVFQRVAPATVFIAAVTPSGTRIGTGAIISPRGLFVTNQHVIGRAREEDLYLFSYRPDERTTADDVLTYVISHQHLALRPTVVRRDADNDLALLALPRREAPYPAIPLGDLDAIQVGQEVAAIGCPYGMIFTLTTGFVGAIWKNSIQTDMRIDPENPGNSGGPLVDMEGRLIAINTFLRADGQSLGFARPVQRVCDLLRQEEGLSGDSPPADQDDPLPPLAFIEGIPPLIGPERAEVVEALVRALSTQKKPQRAFTILGEIGAASVTRGRRAAFGLGAMPEVNEALAPLLRGNDPSPLRALLPALAMDDDRILWRLAETRYVPVWKAASLGVDDVSGTLWAANLAGDLYTYRPERNAWDLLGIGEVKSVTATAGTIYYVVRNGEVWARSPKGQQRLSQASTPGTVHGTRGLLYLLEEGRLYRYGDGAWEREGRPLVTGLQKFVASGKTWYGLDAAGHIYAGPKGAYIDETHCNVGIWLIGDLLLALRSEGDSAQYRILRQRWE